MVELNSSYLGDMTSVTGFVTFFGTNQSTNLPEPERHSNDQSHTVAHVFMFL